VARSGSPRDGEPPDSELILVRDPADGEDGPVETAEPIEPAVPAAPTGSARRR
jgi:hypothetical protein